jgi:uncharacterized metal-binding protein
MAIQANKEYLGIENGKEYPMNEEAANCARCPYKSGDRLCTDAQGKAPGNCPTHNMPELARDSLAAYEKDAGVLEFARQASIQEAAGYANRGQGYAHLRPCKTRIEEIMEFAARMNYRRLGLAFCIGLSREAKAVESLFAARGFEMVSAACKAGRISKARLGLDRNQQLDPEGDEAMCNPVLQAMILNRAKTDFNVLLGLCVGHDSLFLKYSEALCTVLAAKDRVLGHNPLAAVYNADSYYRSLK